MDKSRKVVKGIIRRIGNLGDRALNDIARFNHNWKLKHEYLHETDTIPAEYDKAVKEYWKKYTSKFHTGWHKYYYSRTGLRDVRYIPDDLYYTKIDKHFNNNKMCRGVDNKNYYDLLFPNARQAMTVVRKINGFYYDADYRLIEKEEVIRLCSKHSRLIIKPAVGTGGSKGIVFWNIDQGASELAKFIFDGVENLIVQEIITQHRDLSIIHPSSVNTVRITTLLFKGEVHILSSVLRMGANGSNVDNASTGGVTCGIEENGQLKEIAFSVYGVKYDKHPQGFVFSNCIVPSYEKVKELVIREQTKFAHFRLISWDIAVGEDGDPILIEANLRNGAQNVHQLNNGPMFGELTEEVLQEVFMK